MMQNRTHTCGELRLGDAGKQVKISGWMENVRVVSANLAFVVVRDFYGTTQVVAETEDMVNTFKAITKESTISVEGTVRERDSKTNKMATGDIEIVPAKVEVLGRCQHSELPFQINRSREADETQRLKYRYLDLRNPAVKNNIVLRCQVVAALRAAMTEHGFLEITTPILTASSPEGAREIYIPNEINGVKITAEEQQQLREGRTIFLNDMVNRKGEEFSSFIKADLETGRLSYSRTPDGFEQRAEFKIPDKVWDVELTRKQRSDLQSGKAVLVEGIKGYDGKTISQYVKANFNQGRLDFYNENPDRKRDASQRNVVAETQRQEQGSRKSKGASIA